VPHWQPKGKKVRVALVRRDGETVAELLLRLEAALAVKQVIDEVLPEIKRRRPS
jgi:hypothetical protein